jgi:hypothetical protein
MANSPNLDTSPCSSERAPSPQRPPHLYPPDGLHRSSTEPGVTTSHMLHDVVAVESDAYAALHKAKLFYSQRAVSNSSSTAHPSTARHMPQWGQELLMLYREPPPWSQGQIPPIVKVPSRPRSHEGLASVDRTNERTMKGMQEMSDMLSERHRSMKKKSDGSFDSVTVSTKLPLSRNPFAVRSGESLAPVHDRANEGTITPLPDAATKSTAVKPKSLQSLRPITSLPIPIPPDSSRPVSGNKRHHRMRVENPPRRYDGPNRNSLQINAFHEQSADVSLVCTIGRSGTDRVGPAAARKRSRSKASVSGSGTTKGFDWSSWGKRR